MEINEPVILKDAVTVFFSYIIYIYRMYVSRQHLVRRISRTKTKPFEILLIGTYFAASSIFLNYCQSRF